jgi:hypothetical protein
MTLTVLFPVFPLINQKRFALTADSFLFFCVPKKKIGMKTECQQPGFNACGTGDLKRLVMRLMAGTLAPGLMV